ncbi:MAG: type II secretion system protein [Phycisphaerales bacterium]|nr:type II secretion system protein [Phycisphaerales bacterium]
MRLPGPSSNYFAGQPAPFRAGGFTLIELLAVVGVLSILLALFLPAIGGAKDAATRTAHAQQIRQYAALIEMYTTLSDGYFPLYDPKSAGESAGKWYRPLIKAGLAESRREFIFSGHDLESYPAAHMGTAFVAEQSVFDPEGVPLPQDTILPPARVRASQVRQPSDKGILFSTKVPTPDYYKAWCCLPAAPLGPVAYVDGSAVIARWTDLLPGGWLRVRGPIGYPVWTTWNGVRGVDRATGVPPFSIPKH